MTSKTHHRWARRAGLLPPELSSSQLRAPKGMLDIPVTSKVRPNIGTMSSVGFTGSCHRHLISSRIGRIIDNLDGRLPFGERSFPARTVFNDFHNVSPEYPCFF
jgi:hypothetical protein